MKRNRPADAPLRLRRIVQAVLVAACAPSALAATTLQIDDSITFDYGATVNYGLGMRMSSPSAALVNGPLGAAGLPTTINSDDGNRNFARHSLTTNRLSMLLEGHLKRDNLGLFVRGSAFYDDVYNRSNDNNSPGTVNKSGPANEFTKGARDYEGRRARLLDAYVYGDFNAGDTRLNLRAGNHVVQWGESLYFPNIAGAQAPADATKANVPGAEVKDILLPTGQVSGQWSVSDRLSLLGYVQYQYRPTELSPAGSYFSMADMIGPGADRIYTMANPLLADPASAALPGLPMALTAMRGPDIRPKDSGQWGLGSRFRISDRTELGAYHLRYHDKNPSVVTNLGIATLYPGNATFGIPPITSAVLPAQFQALPVGYQIKYFDNIKLTGASFSTQLEGVSLAGEISYRDGAPVLVNTLLGPTATRSRSWQGQVSAIQTFERTPLADAMTLVGEIGVHRVNSVTPVDMAGMRFNQLSNTRSSWGYAIAWTLNYNNVFNGWDMAVPINFQHLVRGIPAVAGSFGSLTGEGDKRLSVGTTFKYLNNLELGLSYNAFLGSPDARLRPLADRDYVALSAKYSF
ncbi:MAG TPA: DUF1302 domain-containing protein [Noviherbaspirillum sp.]|nr:DUF1302 domain-containing protein [Noviherbaspirillum sp.]